MACPRCGSATGPGAAFCATCGADLAVATAGPMPGAKPVPARLVATEPYRTSTTAIAGFVSAFFCGVLGLILSLLAYGECKRSNGKVGGEGLTVAGIVVSCVLGVVQLVYAAGALVVLTHHHHSY